MMNFALGVIAGSLRKVGATSGGGAFTVDANTLMLLHFDEMPFIDSSSFARTLTNGSAITRVADGSALGGYQANFPNGTNSILISSGYSVLNPNASYTIEFYLTTSTPINGENLVFLYNNNSGDQVYLHTYQGRLYASITGFTEFSTNTLVNDGVRRHVRFVHDASTKTSYIFLNGIIDSQKVQTGSFPGTSGNYPNFLSIGGTYSTGSFTGKLDELRISNVARSTTAFTPP